jgi:hypothetical protein
MKGILLACQFDGMRTRKDKTVAITLGTQELSPDKAGEIFNLNGQILTAYFTHALPNDEEIEIIDSIEPDMPGKSPSQRLRSIFYLMWKSNNEGFKDKNLHYIHYMEKIIDHYKTKLPPT